MELIVQSSASLIWHEEHIGCFRCAGLESERIENTQCVHSMCDRQKKIRSKLAHKLSTSLAVPTGMHGPTCIFWANLTPLSLAVMSVR